MTKSKSCIFLFFSLEKSPFGTDSPMPVKLIFFPKRKKLQSFATKHTLIQYQLPSRTGTEQRQEK
jgi:hypothetical protein